jgi:hypothetical protein
MARRWCCWVTCVAPITDGGLVQGIRAAVAPSMLPLRRMPPAGQRSKSKCELQILCAMSEPCSLQIDSSSAYIAAQQNDAMACLQHVQRQHNACRLCPPFGSGGRTVAGMPLIRGMPGTHATPGPVPAPLLTPCSRRGQQQCMHSCVGSSNSRQATASSRRQPSGQNRVYACDLHPPEESWQAWQRHAAPRAQRTGRPC